MILLKILKTGSLLILQRSIACLVMPATPWGRFHRLPFGPSLRHEDARTVPMAPLTFKLRCSANMVIQFNQLLKTKGIHLV